MTITPVPFVRGFTSISESPVGPLDHVLNVASVAVILDDVPRQDHLACAVLQVCQLSLSLDRAADCLCCCGTSVSPPRSIGIMATALPGPGLTATVSYGRPAATKVRLPRWSDYLGDCS